MNFIEHFIDFNETSEYPFDALKVNNHLHTPYSFSAFSKIEEALDQAVEEKIPIVGVNDFFTFDAYSEWNEGAFNRKLFPLFNVEFIGLNTEDQKNGLKVNDPGNPGRTYFSGKGLAFPQTASKETQDLIDSLIEKANAQVSEMTDKVNDHFKACGYSSTLDFDVIKRELAEKQVRERHLAKAIRLMAEAQFLDKEQLITFYKDVLGKEIALHNVTNEAIVENEIRGALLKAGKPAFVAEDPTGFLPMEKIRSIILEAGGIPTYPFLADAVPGYTDFERDMAVTARTLKDRGVWSVEFIPTRNDINELKAFAKFYQEQGFVVSFGTEHNSPGKQPVEVFAKGGVSLDNELLEINYEGTCIIAAHQYLYSKYGVGVLDKNGDFLNENRNKFVQLGNALIKYTTQSN